MEKNLQHSNRVLSLDILRILAIFSVVVCHVSSLYPDVLSFDWEIKNVYNGLFRWCIAVFFMISGALFLNKKKEISIKSLFSKYILRILLAYLFWSFIYNIYSIYKGDNSFTSITTFCGDVIRGYVHLWFLKVIMGIYITIPILKFIVSNEKTERYFLILWISTTIVIPFILQIVKFFLRFNCLSYFYGDMHLYMAYGFIGYFVLGHYLMTHKIERQFKLIYSMGLLSTILSIFINSFYAHHIGNATFDYGIFTPVVFFQSITIFLFVNKSFKLSTNKKSSLIIQKTIIDISSMSFGVYLIHLLIIPLFHDVFGIDVNLYSPIYTIPLLSVLTFVFCILIARVLRFIPILSKYVL